VSEEVLTTRALNRATLARQLLLERVRLPVSRVVERLCALQAQYSPSPYVALWSRIEGFEKRHLTRALERRSVVKASLMRITLHIVSGRDYPRFAAAWLPGAQAATLSEEEVERLSARVIELASTKRVTVKELEELTAADLGQRLWRLRTLAPLVHVPPSGTWRFHGRVELELWRDALPSFEVGAKRLVQRYLAAFGPATQRDLLKFTGLRVRDVRPGLERLALKRYRTEDGRELLDVPRAVLADPDTPAPVRFLPWWEAALISYDDRERILPAEYRAEVIKSNGEFRPTFLVDGFVAGLWAIERVKQAATLRLTPAFPLPARVQRELVEEGERLVRWIEDDATSFKVRTT
jgi:Winged helix DNA-binding domain